MRPSLPGPEKNPLVGRWEAKMPDGKGGTADCILDVNASSQAVYTDTCPAAVDRFASDADGDEGQYPGAIALQVRQIRAPSASSEADPAGYVAAFKFGLLGGLTTRDNPIGEVSWSKISSDQPLKSGMDNIVANPAWPLDRRAGHRAPLPRLCPRQVAGRLPAHVHGHQADPLQ